MKISRKLYPYSGAAIAVALSTGPGLAMGEELSEKANGLTVTMSTPDGRFEPGEVPFTIQLSENDVDVRDARVELFYGMEPQDGIPPMMHEVYAELSEEGYQAILNVDMMGDWFIDVTIKRDASPSQTVKFEKHFMDENSSH